MLKVDRVQVQAFRIAAHELHRPHAVPADLAVLRLGVQDAGQVAARLATATRLDGDPERFAGATFTETLRAAGVTLAWTHRGAPHLHHADDLPTLATAMVPLDDADAQARLSWQRKDVAEAGMPVTEALTTAASKLRGVVDATMTKGTASEAVSKILPPGLVRWCRGCEATHIHEQLMRLVTLRAGVRLEPDVSPATLTPIDGWPGVTTEPAEAACTRVVEEYLRVHGPATVAEAAAFVSTTRTVAKRMWPDGLAEVRVDGTAAFLPEDLLPALESPPEPGFVRLLPPSDPLLQARDRLTLVPDKANHKEVWRIIGNPGAVLADGEVVATCRARARGRKRLDISVSPLFGQPQPSQSDLETEAARVAAARGFPEATVATGDGAPASTTIRPRMRR
ncbi:MAG: DNA glycosylase AlkZ-like family protein [Thermocrispum sp.]